MWLIDHDKAETDLGRLQAIEHLKSSIYQGKFWIHSLLESMSMWTMPNELFRGDQYVYLLGGEAFDWLLLAQRLIEEIPDRIPNEDRDHLLLSCRPSFGIDEEEFRRYLGPHKYSAYLNYWYGIVVEEALIQCIEEENWKRIRSSGSQYSSYDVLDMSFRQVYGLSEKELVSKFQGYNRDKGYALDPYMNLSEWKEFTYWLFKYRVQNSEGARVASDTHKAIRYLEKMEAGTNLK